MTFAHRQDRFDPTGLFQRQQHFLSILVQLFAHVSPSDYNVELTFVTFFLSATQLNSPRTRSAPPQELFAQMLRQSSACWVVGGEGLQ